MPDQDHPESSPTIVPSIFWTEASGVADKTGRTGKTKESIGERLSRLRRERGITQMELAEHLGVAQPVVSDYERGELRLHGQAIVELTPVIPSRPTSFSASRNSREMAQSKTAGSSGAFKTLSASPSVISELPPQGQLTPSSAKAS